MRLNHFSRNLVWYRKVWPFLSLSHTGRVKQKLLCEISLTEVWCYGDDYNNVLNIKVRYPEMTATATAKSLQSCPTLCDPIDGSPPGSAIPGILQARTLEWVTISFSNAWRWKSKVKSLSCVWLLATPWTAAYQAPPSMGFSRQEYWSGVPLPSPTLKWRVLQKDLCLELNVHKNPFLIWVRMLFIH